MLKVIDINGSTLEVEVVRYFALEGKKYLMYTLNEIDEQNYSKLYAIKVDENNYSVKIEDDSEWTFVKDQIKIIIKANKEGIQSVEDQDFAKIQGITLSDPKVFKLSVDFVNLFKANKKEFPKEETPVFTMELPVLNNELKEETYSEFAEPVFNYTLQEEVSLPVQEETFTESIENYTKEDEVSNPRFQSPTTDDFSFNLPSFGLETEEEVAEFENSNSFGSPIFDTSLDLNLKGSFEDFAAFAVNNVEEKETTNENSFDIPNFADSFAKMEENVMTEVELPKTEPTVEITPTTEFNFISTEPDYSSIELPKEEVNTDFVTNFEDLYEEEKALNEVLKSEISELREKINRISRLLSE